MKKIKVNVMLPASYQLAAGVFAELNSDDQAKFFTEVYEIMAKWGGLEREMQLGYLAKALEKDDVANDFLSQIFTCPDCEARPIPSSEGSFVGNVVFPEKPDETKKVEPVDMEFVSSVDDKGYARITKVSTCEACANEEWHTECPDNPLRIEPKKRLGVLGNPRYTCCLAPVGDRHRVGCQNRTLDDMRPIAYVKDAIINKQKELERWEKEHDKKIVAAHAVPKKVAEAVSQIALDEATQKVPVQPNFRACCLTLNTEEHFPDCVFANRCCDKQPGESHHRIYCPDRTTTGVWSRECCRTLNTKHHHPQCAIGKTLIVNAVDKELNKVSLSYVEEKEIGTTPGEMKVLNREPCGKCWAFRTQGLGRECGKCQ